MSDQLRVLPTTFLTDRANLLAFLQGRELFWWKSSHLSSSGSEGGATSGSPWLRISGSPWLRNSGRLARSGCPPSLGCGESHPCSLQGGLLLLYKPSQFIKYLRLWHLTSWNTLGYSGLSHRPTRCWIPYPLCRLPDVLGLVGEPFLWEVLMWIFTVWVDFLGFIIKGVVITQQSMDLERHQWSQVNWK